MEKITPAKKPSWWIIALVLLIPLGGAVWFGFVSVSPLPFDQFWHDRIIAAKDSFGFSLALALHFIGSTKGMAVVSAIILAVTLIMRRWAHALTISTTMLSVLVASKVIKVLVDRPRPVDMLVSETETSFPSGHSLGAGAIATVLVCFIFANKRVGKAGQVITIIIAGGYICVMMWSRTALHVHWLSDTIAGAALGVVIALIFSRLFLFRDSPLIPSRGRHAL